MNNKLFIALFFLFTLSSIQDHCSAATGHYRPLYNNDEEQEADDVDNLLLTCTMCDKYLHDGQLVLSCSKDHHVCLACTGKLLKKSLPVNGIHHIQKCLAKDCGNKTHLARRRLDKGLLQVVRKKARQVRNVFTHLKKDIEKGLSYCKKDTEVEICDNCEQYLNDEEFVLACTNSHVVCHDCIQKSYKNKSNKNGIHRIQKCPIPNCLHKGHPGISSFSFTKEKITCLSTLCLAGGACYYCTTTEPKSSYFECFFKGNEEACSLECYFRGNEEACMQ